MAFRLPLYEQRRQGQLRELLSQLPFLQSKLDFLRVIIDGQLRLGRPRQVLSEELVRDHGIPAEFHARLLAMDLNSLTEERVAQVRQALADTQATRDFYAATTPTELWLRDLAALKTALAAFWAERQTMDATDDDRAPPLPSDPDE